MASSAAFSAAIDELEHRVDLEGHFALARKRVRIMITLGIEGFGAGAEGNRLGDGSSQQYQAWN